MYNTESLLELEYDIVWLPKPNEGRIVLSSVLPPLELVSTALVLAFADDQLLLTRLVERGWDIPGGHIEPGELPEEAAHREVYEETGAKLGPLHLLAYQRLRLLGPKPSNYNYPYPDSHQVFYWAHITSLEDFQPTAEAQECALFSPNRAQTVRWVQKHTTLYQAALANAYRGREK